MTVSSDPDGFTLGTTEGRISSLDIKAPACEILVYCRSLWPDVEGVVAGAREAVPWCKREIWPWQAALLALLAHQCDRAGGRILEIGTALGYSAAVMALAAPRASIETLNPKAGERERAAGHLTRFRNVRVLAYTSAEHYDNAEQYSYSLLDLVFVDGSHVYDAVKLDCRWWEYLRPGGLLLFHDYSPAASKRPCPEVVRAVDEFRAGLGRAPDVLAVDEKSVGMAGWYKP